MLHRGAVALHQLLGRVAGALVQRRQHDVEPLEDAVRKIEPAVGQDVDLAAVQDRDLRISLAQRARSRPPVAATPSTVRLRDAAECGEWSVIAMYS